MGMCAYPRSMADGSAPPTKRCASCGGEYLFAFFRHNTNIHGSRTLTRTAQPYHDRCIGCEAKSKGEELKNQRLRRKAIGTRRRHAAKLRELGKLRSEGDLENLYGWSLERMIENINNVIKEGCPYCLQLPNVAEEGLGIVTLDILNPNDEPHYSTNVRWCCTRCNSVKQRISPTTWGARLSMWSLWRRNQIRLATDPEAFGFLALPNNQLDQSPALW
jgi:hypothetical protein